MKWAFLDKLGLPGVVGIGLLLFGLSFYVGNVAPLEHELNMLESQRSELLAAAAAKAASPEGVAARNAARLPPLAASPALLQRLNALAEKHGVAIERSAYQIQGKEGPRRLEVSMPLRAGYPALRAYLRDALALEGSSSLDELSLQRAQASDPLVLAQVRLSYGFSAAP